MAQMARLEVERLESREAPANLVSCTATTTGKVGCRAADQQVGENPDDLRTVNPHDRDKGGTSTDGAPPAGDDNVFFGVEDSSKYGGQSGTTRVYAGNDLSNVAGGTQGWGFVYFEPEAQRVRAEGRPVDAVNGDIGTDDL